MFLTKRLLVVFLGDGQIPAYITENGKYDPGLVLLAREPSCGFGEAAWAQIISLLQGLAQGHTLALLQEGEEGDVGATAASPLGDPALSLRPLGTPLPENVEAMERLRQRLQTHWGLLQTADALGKEAKNKGQNQNQY
eukprot:XP_014025286.1 PREDICTED: histone deacetylase 10-like [Salmo salar]